VVSVVVVAVVDIFKLNYSIAKMWHNHKKLNSSKQQPIHSIPLAEHKNQRKKKLTRQKTTLTTTPLLLPSLKI